MQNLTKEEIDWLLTQFSQYVGKPLKGETLKSYYRAEMLLTGADRMYPRDCTCEYRGMADNVNRLYKEFMNE